MVDPKPQPAAELPKSTKRYFSDLEGLQRSINQEAAAVGSQELLTRCPARKPRRTEFIRMHRDPSMRFQGFVYSDRDEGEDMYWVDPGLVREFDEGMVKSAVLTLTISRKGILFMWPLIIPGDAKSLGRSWHETAWKAAEEAKEKWVRVAADRRLSGYRIHVAVGEFPEPTWPDRPFNELLELAFEGRNINSIDHQILRDLRSPE
jgi:hypothetical protein